MRSWKFSGLVAWFGVVGMGVGMGWGGGRGVGELGEVGIIEMDEDGGRKVKCFFFISRKEIATYLTYLGKL